MTASQTVAVRRVAAVVILLSAVFALAAPGASSAASKRSCKHHVHGFCTGRLVGPLVVSGRKILDNGQRGVPVLFQGVMFDGPGWLEGQPSYDPRGFPDTGAINTLKAWGVNFVRLALSSDIYNQRCHEDYRLSYPSPGYRQDVTNTVRRLTADGMYVDILLYTSNPECKFSGPNTSGEAPMPGADAVTFWRAIARKFGRNPLVGFEPWNEPEVCARNAVSAVPITANCKQANLAAGWARSLTMRAGKTYVDTGMDRMYQVIHAAAPRSLIFLDANGWGAQSTTYDSLPSDIARSKQVVYALHPYDCQETTAPIKGARSTATCHESTPEWCPTIAARLRSFDHDPARHERLSRPVVFDEIGFPEGEQIYQAPRTSHSRNLLTHIKIYEHGLFLHNFVAEAQSFGNGFAFFTFNDADTGSDWNGPYLLTKQPIKPGSRGPWPASADGAVMQRAGNGPALHCVAPPSGFDIWG